LNEGYLVHSIAFDRFSISQSSSIILDWSSLTVDKRWTARGRRLRLPYRQLYLTLQFLKPSTRPAILCTIPTSNPLLHRPYNRDQTTRLQAKRCMLHFIASNVRGPAWNIPAARCLDTPTLQLLLRKTSTLESRDCTSDCSSRALLQDFSSFRKLTSFL
jgi:hypothetical protein